MKKTTRTIEITWEEEQYFSFRSRARTSRIASEDEHDTGFVPEDGQGQTLLIQEDQTYVGGQDEE